MRMINVFQRCLPDQSILAKLGSVPAVTRKKRTFLPARQAAIPNAVARWVFPVLLASTKIIFSRLSRYSPFINSRTCA